MSSITRARAFTIHWQANDIAANSRVNPGPKDRRVVRSYGFTPVLAASRFDAEEQFRRLFPECEIVPAT